MKFLASHESSTRGTFDFPIELYYVDKMHPRYEMPFHWHMEFELMLVLSGEFSLLIDGRSYLLQGRCRHHFSRGRSRRNPQRLRLRVCCL